MRVIKPRNAVILNASASRITSRIMGSTQVLRKQSGAERLPYTVPYFLLSDNPDGVSTKTDVLMPLDGRAGHQRRTSDRRGRRGGAAGASGGKGHPEAAFARDAARGVALVSLACRDAGWQILLQAPALASALSHVMLESLCTC